MSTPSSGGPRAEIGTGDALDQEYTTGDELKVGYENVQYIQHEHGSRNFFKYLFVFTVGLICAGTITMVQEKCCSANKGEEFESLLVEEI